MNELPLVLIICTGNAVRSQMAEGFLRAAAKGRFEVASAGSHAAGYVHPLAIKVMQETGIDISTHRSKNISEFLNRPVDTVITVCGTADQACPNFPGQSHRLHWPFRDPSHVSGAEAEKVAAFRETRDQIQRAFEAYAASRADAAR